MPISEVHAPALAGSIERLHLGIGAVREASPHSWCWACGGCAPFEVDASGSLDQWGLQVCSCAEFSE